MRPITRIVLAGSLLAGCSAQVLDEIGEVTPPRPCAEAVKLFGTFSMRAKSIAWKGNKGGAPAELTVDLAFYNDKNFPIALSNSGNGVLYTVRFSVQGKDGAVAPKEASGVVLTREEKAPRHRRNAGPFGETRKKGAGDHASSSKKSDEQTQTKDINFRIKPGEPQEGRLVFQLPRDNYLLTVERKFTETSSARQPTDLIAACKIPQNDVSGPAPGISGVY